MYEQLDCDVAIVGSGPAGLAAACELRRRGIGRVVVLERDDEPGGIPRHCAHPPYGLREYGRLMTGPSYALRNVAVARAAGVEIFTRYSVVALKPGGKLELSTPKGPLSIQAQRVLTAMGARETPRAARLIGGDRPLGVLNTGALQAYLHLKRLKPFSRPLIVGSELVALSAVLSCLRAGIRPVAMIEAEPHSTAPWPMALFPPLCGVPLHLSTRLERIEGGERVAAAHLIHTDGRRERMPCDGVLLTGQFTPEASLVRLAHLKLDPNSGGPAIDQFGRCSDPSYFAAGNLLRPIETAGWSWSEGKRIAGYIADDLANKLPSASLPTISINCAAPLKYCLPQQLIVGATDGLDLQLRVTRRAHGTLVLQANGHTVWQRTRTFLPERRLLIPLGKLNGAAITQLDVAIHESR